jgi:hypothetical protein
MVYITHVKNYMKKQKDGQAPRLMPVILATQEDQGSKPPRKIVRETLSQKKKNHKKGL